MIACVTFVVLKWLCVEIGYMRKRKCSGREWKRKQQYEYSGKKLNHQKVIALSIKKNLYKRFIHLSSSPLKRMAQELEGVDKQTLKRWRR